ncbi:MAG TPA: Gfo/Idh/MocA family oxidoreductase [Bryobacteraceae bacterium]|nr:Gfo/Idh/MocA family oxidoreductase [Bryobacteraceae bacterium]
MPTRRSFLTTAAAAATPALFAQAPTPIRVAVIGVGNRGSFLLGNTIKVPGVEVIAVCDLDPNRTEKAAAQISGKAPARYSDFRKMLDERKDIDAVIIATPVDTHKMIAIAALEVGKHVYCEKPMAATLEDTRIMASAARSAKGIFQAGFQLRHDPARNAAVRFIRDGKAGRVLYLQGYRHSGDLPRDTPWLFDSARSGDAIVEQACHILDLFVWAIGKPPLRAMGSGGINLYQNQPQERSVTDNYSIIYEFPDDIRVTFSHIFFDPKGFSGIKERVWCSKGAVDLAAGTFVDLETGAATKLVGADAGQDSNYLSLAAFFDNARGRQTPLNNAESASISTMVAILGRTAIREKRIVTWDEVAKG